MRTLGTGQALPVAGQHRLEVEHTQSRTELRDLSQEPTDHMATEEEIHRRDQQLREQDRARIGEARRGLAGGNPEIRRTI